MTQNQAKFESFLWHQQLSELESIFGLIDDFLNNQESIELYLDKRHQDDQFGIRVLEDSAMKFPSGVQIFHRQMVILLKVYLDQICKEFLTSLKSVQGNQTRKSESKGVIDKIEKLANVEFQAKTKDALLKLIYARNIFAHEIVKDDVEAIFLIKSLEAVKDLITVLSNACAKNNIMDVDYSHWKTENNL